MVQWSCPSHLCPIVRESKAWGPSMRDQTMPGSPARALGGPSTASRAWVGPPGGGVRLARLNGEAPARIPGPTFMIFGGVIGFAPGFLQYRYPLSGTSTKGRPEV